MIILLYIFAYSNRVVQIWYCDSPIVRLTSHTCNTNQVLFFQILRLWCLKETCELVEHYINSHHPLSTAQCAGPCALTFRLKLWGDKADLMIHQNNNCSFSRQLYTYITASFFYRDINSSMSHCALWRVCVTGVVRAAESVHRKEKHTIERKWTGVW